MGKKTITGTKNVYELAQERLKVIFNEFDNIYVSFSGGKDSGVLLNMCIDYIRRNNLKIRLGVFHMDYEIQYKMTIDYVDRILEANKDILDVYRVCGPFRVSTCTSMYQSFWRPWEDNKKDIWVRSMPKKAMKKEDFPFYNTTMWDYEFQMRFAQWIHQKKDAVRTCCLIGIRTQESFNRWRCIYMSRKFQMYHKYRWTSKVGNDIYNAYPIFDWKTTDVWTANGKFQWDYNVLYDLYYRAGVNLERQRVASPFINEAQESLALYRALAQDTPVILLDEPTAFLDLPNRYELATLLRRLTRDEGKCILFSTHDLDVALSLCDSVALIDTPSLHHLPAGEMVGSGLIERLFSGENARFDPETRTVRLR